MKKTFVIFAIMIGLITTQAKAQQNFDLSGSEASPNFKLKLSEKKSKTETGSDFQLTTSAGYGIIINSKAEYSLFQSNVSVSPSYRIGDFVIGAQTTALTNDSTTTMLNGAYLKYIVKRFAGEKSLSLSGHFLLGFEGDFVSGGTVSYDVGSIGFDLSVSQEYLRRELWITTGVRFDLIPY